jgi:hypothetical protein
MLLSPERATHTHTHTPAHTHTHTHPGTYMPGPSLPCTVTLTHHKGGSRRTTSLRALSASPSRRCLELWRSEADSDAARPRPSESASPAAPLARHQSRPSPAPAPSPNVSPNHRRLCSDLAVCNYLRGRCRSSPATLPAASIAPARRCPFPDCRPWSRLPAQREGLCGHRWFLRVIRMAMRAQLRNSTTRNRLLLLHQHRLRRRHSCHWCLYPARDSRHRACNPRHCDLGHLTSGRLRSALPSGVMLLLPDR